MINFDSYRKVWCNLDINETISTCHEECADVRSRLYFTAKNGFILGYCHNCAEGGCIQIPLYFKPPLTISALTGIATPQKIPSIPTGTVPVGHPDFVSCHEWCSEELMAAAGVRLDVMDIRYVIPVADTMINEKLYEYKGYITRRLHGSPKYSYHVHDSFRGWMSYNGPGRRNLFEDGLAIVLVEDQMSACRIGQCGHIGIAMFGAKHSIEKVHEIVKFYGPSPRYVVWYDNDNEQVNNAARITHEYIKLLGPRANLSLNKTEPKHMTTTQILEELNSW